MILCCGVIFRAWGLAVRTVAGAIHLTRPPEKNFHRAVFHSNPLCVFTRPISESHLHVRPQGHFCNRFFLLNLRLDLMSLARFCCKVGLGINTSPSCHGMSRLWCLSHDRSFSFLIRGLQGFCASSVSE